MSKAPPKQPHPGDFVLWFHTAASYGAASAMLQAEDTAQRRRILKAAQRLRDLVAPLLPESHR